MSYQRIMALDIGDKRIGIAVSDPLRITAQGLETYTRKDDASDVAYIALLVAKYDVECLVCGLPLMMNGSVGIQAEKVKAFAKILEEKVSIPLIYHDERLTTLLAERVLLEADVSRMKRKKVIDKMAAQAILQSYLDQIH